MSELRDVQQIGYYESRLGYDTVGWFADEKLKLEKKSVFILTTFMIIYYND